MKPVLFDTSIYIASLRAGNESEFRLRNIEQGSPLWLSAVVLEELYAGADVTGRKKLAQMERDFDKIKRLLVPNLDDWTKTGKILNKIGQKYGFEQIGRTRLTNDVLIAVSATRLGIILLTDNRRDFARIAGFCALKWALW
jgi:predicted nucleic acid-binding protein